jgi:hypothetical protein
MKIYKKMFAQSFFAISMACIAGSVHAEDSNTGTEYRRGHKEICYQVANTSITCGNFEIENTLIARKYDKQNIGTNVLASFNMDTHPGDYPYLSKLSKELGFIENNEKSTLDQPISTWLEMDSKDQENVVVLLSSKIAHENKRDSYSTLFRQCLDYWSHPDAEYDSRKIPPKIAEVGAMCVAGKGLLGKER